MKKLAAIALCVVLVLLLIGCESSKKEKVGDTTVKVDGKVYYNTKKKVSAEPPESEIVYAELPLEGSTSDETVTAYAFIGEEAPDDTLTCRINGKWYQFNVTQPAGAGQA